MKKFSKAKHSILISVPHFSGRFHLKILAISALFFCTCGMAFAQEDVQYFSEFEYFKDSSKQASLESVLRSNFTSETSSALNLGSSDCVYWLKIENSNRLFQTDAHTICLESPILDDVDFFLVDENGIVRDSLSYRQGNPTQPNKFSAAMLGYEFEPNIARNPLLLVRVASQKPILIPIFTCTEDGFSNRIVTGHWTIGLYVGIILVMMLYNLFLYFSTRTVNYVYYVLYVMSVGLTQLSFTGYGDLFLWAGSEFWMKQDIYIFGALSGIFTLLFSRSFLGLNERLPKIDKVLLFLAGLDVLAILLALLGFGALAYNIINIVAGVGSLAFLIIGIYLALKGVRAALFFTVAFSVFLAAVVVFTLKDTGIIAYSSFSRFAMIIGHAIEATLLSIALADQINVLRQEKLTAQQESYDILVQSQKEKERQNQELTKANDELERFIYSASHDLRAPLASARGLITIAKAEPAQNPYMGMIEKSVLNMDMFVQNIIVFYQNRKQAPLISEVKMSALIDEIFETYQHMDGAHQIEFKKTTNSDLKINIDLLRLKSILDNLVSNAIKYHDLSKQEPFIAIEAARKGSFLSIIVSDNGKGIETDHLPYIFEMFHRASAKGIGTGIGLHIVEEAVKILKGEINVTSEVGVGSTFSISLPID